MITNCKIPKRKRIQPNKATKKTQNKCRTMAVQCIIDGNHLNLTKLGQLKVNKMFEPVKLKNKLLKSWKHFKTCEMMNNTI